MEIPYSKQQTNLPRTRADVILLCGVEGLSQYAPSKPSGHSQ